MKITSDLLKEKGKYSIGRVLLFVSVGFYLGTQLIALIASFKENHPVDLEILSHITEALQYPIGVAGSYITISKFAKAENKEK